MGSMDRVITLGVGGGCRKPGSETGIIYIYIFYEDGLKKKLLLLLTM